MIFGDLEITAAVKLLAAYSAHAVAAKGALAVQHLLPAATHVALHHPITYAINYLPSLPLPLFTLFRR